MIVDAAIRGGVMPWINRLRAGYTEQGRVVTESTEMRHRNGNFRYKGQ